MPDSHLTLARVGAWDAAVDRLVARCGDAVPLPGLLGDLNRRARRTSAPGRGVETAWRYDLRDQLDLRWWPQGVTTDCDADTGGHASRLCVITWYAKKTPLDAVKQGSRLTVLDLESGRYRHVLLVRAHDEKALEPLTVHAGGLVWRDRQLHVAATGRGFFTASTDDLLRVPDDLRDAAFGYRYVLPVRAQYRPEKDAEGHAFRFSFFSYDRETSALLAGEYTDDPQRSRRIASFPLDDVGLPAAAPGTLLGSGPRRMQGVARVGDRLHATVSQGRLTRGSLYSASPDDVATGQLADPAAEWRHATPMGCEDLAHDPGHRELWSVSEHPGVRWAFTMRPPA